MEIPKVRNTGAIKIRGPPLNAPPPNLTANMGPPGPNITEGLLLVPHQWPCKLHLLPVTCRYTRLLKKEKHLVQLCCHVGCAGGP